MLTALVVREHTQLDDVVTVPRAAEIINDGDAGLVRGQKLTVRQLLNIMLIPSANDAAEALAIHVGGTEKRFVALMNAKAKALGLTHTVAADPHGLGKHEHSTAHDLSVLAHEVLSDRILRAIVRQRSVAVPRVHGKPSIYPSTDLLLGKYGGIEGVKTGFTNPAGYCFVGAAKRGGVELYGVVLGTSSISARFSEMRKLLDWGFAHTKVRTVVSAEETAGTVPVHRGEQPSVAVRASRSETIPLPTTGPSIRKRVVLIPSVVAPVSAGQQLGLIEVSRGKSVIATVPLVAEEAVAAKPVIFNLGATAATPALHGLGAAWGEFWSIVARQAAFV
jgi:D-alanyl-D-alanine carboxypeptidase (penicillin-binding protein 5/6)